MTLNYVLKVCNYNDVDMDYAGGADPSGFRLYYNSAGKQESLVQTEIKSSVSNPKILKSKECLKENRSVDVPTDTLAYYMESTVKGPLVDYEDGYCYAYSFNSVVFKHDYGDGECVFHVSGYMTSEFFTAVHVRYFVNKGF